MQLSNECYNEKGIIKRDMSISHLNITISDATDIS